MRKGSKRRSDLESVILVVQAHAQGSACVVVVMHWCTSNRTDGQGGLLLYRQKFGMTDVETRRVASNVSRAIAR